MDHILRDLPFCRCYNDDIVVWSNIVEEHLKHLEEIFKRLREARRKVHPGKCVFAASTFWDIASKPILYSLKRRSLPLFGTCLHLRIYKA